VDRTVPRWIALYRQLQEESPNSTIYAIGYPSIASDLGRCSLNVSLSKGELEFAEELIHYLDGSIQEAASAANIPYVDISQALAGHRLCEASGSAVAVNGLTSGKDFGIFGIGLLGRESYHPNALGHQLIEQEILRQTNNLSVKGSPSANPPPTTGNLLSAPKTGRQLNTLIRDNITVHRARPGENTPVRISGARAGLRPNSVYVARLDGPTGPILGSAISSPDCDVVTSINIPLSTVPDIHTIDIIGPGQSDGQVDITQPVYITTDAQEMGYNVGQHLVKPTDSKMATLAHHSPDAAPPVSKKDNGNRLPGKVLGTESGHLSVSAQALKSPNPIHHQSTNLNMVLAGALIIVAFIFCGLKIIKFCRPNSVKYCNNLPKKDYEKCAQCFTIVIMRRFGVVVFCLVLFISLLAVAFSTSSNVVLGNPKKIEKWLGQSGLYNSFVGTAIEQADDTAGSDQSGGVSLSDTAVKQAAEAAFPPELVQRNVNLFLDSNYAWLDGNVAKPQFKIDLTEAKANFAQRVGKYVKTYLATLPGCTPAQEARIDVSTVDPLTLSCRPSKLDPAKEGALVTQQMESNGDFLSDPVITPDTFNSKNAEQGAPYYVQYANAPQTYRLGKKIPWITGILTILSTIAVYFLTMKRRNGIKIVAATLGAAGVVLILTKLVADQMFHSLERHIFNQATIGQLQKTLTVFLHHIETQLVKIDFWFGVGYLLLAAVLVGILALTRQRGLRIPKPLQMLNPSESNPESAKPPAPKTQKPAPKPRQSRPPRLVQ
jgi:hypothetical protein